jgi:hypothetical protein
LGSVTGMKIRGKRRDTLRDEVYQKEQQGLSRPSPLNKANLVSQH